MYENEYWEGKKKTQKSDYYITKRRPVIYITHENYLTYRLAKINPEKSPSDNGDLTYLF